MKTKRSNRKHAAAPAEAVEQTLRQGLALQQAGDLKSAAAVYRDVLDERPRETRALTLLAAIYQAQGALDEAKRLFQTALDLDPALPAPRLQLAAMALRENQARQARLLIKPFTEAAPKDPNGWNIRGWAAHESGAIAEAVTCFAKAEALGDVRAAAYLGGSLEVACDLPAAAGAYRRYLEHAPNDGPVHAALGAALDKQGLPNDAVDSYRRALAIDPTNWEANAALGLNLNKRGDFEGAAEAYQAALPYAPATADVLNNIGFSDCIAENVEDFGAIAARLTADPEALAAKRQAMRERLILSPLMDGAACAESFAQGSRDMIRQIEAAAD